MLTELLAPVAGGMRWRTDRDSYIEGCRRRAGLPPHPPASRPGGEASAPEFGTACGPEIVSLPPVEARMGGEYVYRAHAYDGIGDGFTWYFEESPPGMRVDRHGGESFWTPSEGGRVRVVLCARSVYGAVSRQEWTIRVRKAVSVRRSAACPRFVAALRKRAASLRGRAFRIARPGRADEAPRGPAPRAASPPGTRFRAATPLRI